MDTVGVFIADDNELVRFAVRTLLQVEPDIEVVGEANVAAAIVLGCEEARPDVLILGASTMGAGAAEICREVRARCTETAVVILSSAGAGEEVFEALAAGACGYLLKDTTPERLIEAVRCVATGQSVFDTAVADQMVADHARHSEHLDIGALSERETEVLTLMAKGLSNKEIGHALWIGETTVKTHVSHILRKLDSADRTQAVLAAVKLGLIHLGL